MRGQLRHALWAGKWRGRYLHPCNKNRGKGDPAQIINFLLIIYFNSKHSCPSTSPVFVFHGSPSQELDEDGALIHDPVQECNDLINNRGCVKQYVNKGITCETNTKTKSRVPTVNQTRQKLFLDLKNVFLISKNVLRSQKKL